MRGAKQPLPEPHFQAPPITQADLQLLEMLPPKLDFERNQISSEGDKDLSPVASDSDSDEPSTSSSCSSSSEDAQTKPDTAVLVLNEKAHVIHAARATNPDSSKRSCFKIKEFNYELTCGSSVLDAPVKFVPEIPLGARVCQRKACVMAIDNFLN